MPGCGLTQEALAQFPVVIDLAVQDGPDLAPLACDRRIASQQVDHGQAGLAYRSGAEGEHTCGVGPPVFEEPQLSPDGALRCTGPDGPSYTAHVVRLT